MAWDWATDTAKGILAFVLGWIANYLRKRAKPTVLIFKKIGNLVKIIETLEAKQAITASEQLANYHISKNPIYILDNMGAATYVNPAWVCMAGLRDDHEALGFGWMRAIHPEDREEMEREIALLEKKQSSFPGKVRIVNFQTGAVKVFECISELVNDDKGKVVKIIGTLYPD